MKSCPACGTTYTDNSLIYCLADGNPLTDSEEQQTVLHTGNAGGIRIEIPQVVATPQYSVPATTQEGGNGKKIAFVVGLFGIIVVAAIVGAGALLYFNRDTRSANSINASSAPNIPTSPTPDKNEELRDQIANLEKQISDKKKNSKPSNLPLKMPDQPTSQTSARANSPSDGFLALRSLPSSEIGDRIAKIPHGANVSIGACGPIIKPVSRSGRWCQANYNGMSGWVFDAYLTF